MADELSMGYGVTPEMVSGAANDCVNTAASIEQQLAAVRNYVIGLRAEWKGVAAAQFDAVMYDYDYFAHVLHNALINISDGLNNNYHNYVNAEADASMNLKKVGDQIPGARL